MNFKEDHNELSFSEVPEKISVDWLLLECWIEAFWENFWIWLILSIQKYDSEGYGIINLVNNLTILPADDMP